VGVLANPYKRSSNKRPVGIIIFAGKMDVVFLPDFPILKNHYLTKFS